MQTEASEPSPWKNPRLLHMASLSFPGAIPLAVVLTTLPAWLADHDIKASDIGLIGLAGLPWSFKFLWAPLIDRYRPSFGGRRRGWVMLMQVALCLAIGAVGLIDPTKTTMVLGIGFMIAAFSATQDIAMDAYAVEYMKKSEQGPGNSLRTTFYRAGMMASGGLAVASADAFDWSIVFLGIGGMMLVGVLLTATAQEPAGEILTPKTFAEAVTAPVIAFFRRDGVLALAAFVLLYKLGDNMALSMTAPMIIQKLGVAKVEYGSIQKILGTSATITGVLIGGALIAKIGLGRCLWLFGFLQASVNGLFALTAYSEGYRPIMYAAIGLEAAMAGMGTAALLTLLTRITEKRYAATQFALLTSLMGLGRTLASPPSGFIVEAIGYGPFFLCTIAAGIPGLFFLSRFVPFGAKEPVLVDPNG
jgi:MFS transporter, PAT family, beta-lactamase induction signal transducer AmpG